MNQRLDNTGLTDDLLAERLRQLRKQAGLSQKALAERLGISGPAIAQWETGRHRPDTRWLPKLASLLNCQPSDLRPDLFYHQQVGTPRFTPASQLLGQRVADFALSETDSTPDSTPELSIDWAQHTDLIRLESSPLTVTPSIPVPATAEAGLAEVTEPVVGLSPLQLRRARQQRRLERRELAALLHVDTLKIQQWEQGSARPNEWQSHRLAQVLGLRDGQSRTVPSRVKFTVLQAPNAVRVPILPIYDRPPADPASAASDRPSAIGHMPALHAQATLVFRLPVGRWESPLSATWLHVQVSPCQAADLTDGDQAVRLIDGGLCLRQRLNLEGQTLWFVPASRFGAAQTSPLQTDEWVWRVWAVVTLSDDMD
ncbi:MAG: helix-turn-helix transcriptional regulator [Moraxellaceae bacterium]